MEINSKYGGRKMKPPEIMRLNSEERDALLERLKGSNISEADYALIKAIITTISFLYDAFHEKSNQLKKILKQIFDIKSKKVLKSDKFFVFVDKNSNGSDNKMPESGIILDSKQDDVGRGLNSNMDGK